MEGETPMKKQELTIEGMSCDHCVMSVRKELSKIAGLSVENVQIGKAKVEIDESKVNRQVISRAIDEAGYHLISVQ
jgi:copper chaperone